MRKTYSVSRPISLRSYVRGRALHAPVKVAISSPRHINFVDVVPWGCAIRTAHQRIRVQLLRVAGTAQIGIVAPDGSSQTFVVEPGDVQHTSPRTGFTTSPASVTSPSNSSSSSARQTRPHRSFPGGRLFPPEVLAATFAPATPPCLPICRTRGMCSWQRRRSDVKPLPRRQRVEGERSTGRSLNV